MKFHIVCGEANAQEIRTFNYMNDEPKRPMALDVLLQAKATSMPDLAFRYGCRNEMCGVCTIEINGQPRLACRCRVDEGDTLAPLTTLPVLRDLVIERDAINRQLIDTIPPSPPRLMQQPSPEMMSLNRCIECYGCLSECPMHQKNGKPQPDQQKVLNFGNPYTLLRLQRARLDPDTTPETKTIALLTAIGLGLNSCLDCEGCKCQVGISLNREVIEPLLGAAASMTSDF